MDGTINCACAPSAVQDGRVVVHAKMDICPLPASGGKRNVFNLQNEQHRAVSWGVLAVGSRAHNRSPVELAWPTSVCSTCQSGPG